MNKTRTEIKVGLFVILGLILFLAVVFLFVNLIVDLSYGILDPRIRYS